MSTVAITETILDVFVFRLVGIFPPVTRGMNGNFTYVFEFHVIHTQVNKLNDPSKKQKSRDFGELVTHHYIDVIDSQKFVLTRVKSRRS